MKIIILAAGKGERLYPLTRNMPKSLLDMGNGRTLLEEQIERIRVSGVISEIILVTGYLTEKIESKMRVFKDAGISIKAIYNPFYDVSNNLISMWFTKEQMTSSFLVTNGDNLFAADVFKRFILENKDGIYLAVSRKNHYDDDDMKVTLRKQLIQRLDKDTSLEMTHAESPGLLLVDGARAVATLKDELETMVKRPEHRNSFWLEVLNSIARRGIPVNAWEFDGARDWQEIDIHLDVEKVRNILGIVDSDEKN